VKHKIRRLEIDDDTKVEIQNKNTKYQRNKQTKAMAVKETAFTAVQGMSMVDPSILNTKAYAVLSDEVLYAFKEGPEYECTVCLKLEFRRSVI
jgi:hypothetical protein